MLVLKGNLTEADDNASFDLFDKTGIFSANNLSGWEDPTTAFIADVTSATATFYLPDPITLAVTTTNPVIIDVFPTLPNVILTPYNVLATALGYTDGLLIDGQYVCNYTVVVDISGTPTTFTFSINKIFFGRACCCIEQMVDNIEICGCKDNASAANYLYGKALVAAIKKNCNKTKIALEILAELQSICRQMGCTSC